VSFLLHNTPSKSRRSKYRMGFTSLLFPTLKNLQSKIVTFYIPGFRI